MSDGRYYLIIFLLLVISGNVNQILIKKEFDWINEIVGAILAAIFAYIFIWMFK